MFQSPDGDVIDCVLSHLQPAFDHPQLKGQKPLVLLFQAFLILSCKTNGVFQHRKHFISFLFSPQEAPERPKANNSTEAATEVFQLWTHSGESCPEGTIPIRRITEKDVSRADSVEKFGRKLRRGVRRDTMSSDHEVSL